MKIIKEARRYATVIINDETFTLDRLNPIPYEYNLGGYGQIWDAYNNPSETKEIIWKQWRNWFYEHDGNCTVSSKNCNFFTIEGFVTDEDTGRRYFCYITHANNRLYEVEG